MLIHAPHERRPILLALLQALLHVGGLQRLLAIHVVSASEALRLVCKLPALARVALGARVHVERSSAAKAASVYFFINNLFLGLNFDLGLDSDVSIARSRDT